MITSNNFYYSINDRCIKSIDTNKKLTDKRIIKKVKKDIVTNIFNNFRELIYFNKKDIDYYENELDNFYRFSDNKTFKIDDTNFPPIIKKIIIDDTDSIIEVDLDEEENKFIKEFVLTIIYSILTKDGLFIKNINTGIAYHCNMDIYYYNFYKNSLDVLNINEENKEIPEFIIKRFKKYIINKFIVKNIGVYHKVFNNKDFRIHLDNENKIYIGDRETSKGIMTLNIEYNLDDFKINNCEYYTVYNKDTTDIINFIKNNCKYLMFGKLVNWAFGEKIIVNNDGIPFVIIGKKLSYHVVGDYELNCVIKNKDFDNKYYKKHMQYINILKAFIKYLYPKNLDEYKCCKYELTADNNILFDGYLFDISIDLKTFLPFYNCKKIDECPNLTNDIRYDYKKFYDYNKLYRNNNNLQECKDQILIDKLKDIYIHIMVDYANNDE